MSERICPESLGARAAACSATAAEYVKRKSLGIPVTVVAKHGGTGPRIKQASNYVTGRVCTLTHGDIRSKINSAGERSW